jgi:hypothetical protein
MQINTAGRALRLPSDKKIIRDFFLHLWQMFMALKIQAVLGNCQESFMQKSFW